MKKGTVFDRLALLTIRQGNYAALRDTLALRLASKLADLRAAYANLPRSYVAPASLRG